MRHAAACRRRSWSPWLVVFALASSAGARAQAPQQADEPEPTRSGYALPALEIVGFDFLLNRFNHRFGTDRDDYAVTIGSIRRNLSSNWDVDNDAFRTNQLGHPYQGSMYHGFARSAGFNYWESLGYTFAGSALWEIAGERTAPSRNDQISSGIGGSFLGEALFRMSNLLLETADWLPYAWREAGAAIISPATGFNRWALGGVSIRSSTATIRRTTPASSSATWAPHNLCPARPR